LDRIREREVDPDLEVVPSLAALLLLLPATAAAAAEAPAEDVAEIAEIPEVEPLGREVEAPARPAAAVRRAEGVVLLALLGVGEDVVSRLHFLEALLGRLVARIRVRVVLPGELAVGLLDLVLARGFRDAERLVEILNRGHRSPGHRRPPAAPRPRLAPAGSRGRRAYSPSAGPRAPSPPPRPRAAKAAPRGRAGRSARSSRSRPGPRASTHRAGTGGRGG